jgi:hypothetical protein
MCPYFKQWLTVIIIRPQPNKKKFEGNDERNNDNKTLAGLPVFLHVVLAQRGASPCGNHCRAFELLLSAYVFRQNHCGKAVRIF